jgi:TAP-like protein
VLSVVGTEATDRSHWDILARLVIQFQQALTSGALTQDTTNAIGAMSAAPAACTFRSFTPPERPVNLQRNGYPTGLVLQAEFDPATKYEGGAAMARKLRDHLITVVDDGSHGVYVRNDCVTRQVDDYLIRGTLPSKTSTCAGAPRPDVPADGQQSGPGKTGGSLTEQLKSLATRYPDLPVS